MRTFFRPKALIRLWIVQCRKHRRTAIHLFYLCLSQLSRAPTRLHNELILAQFQQIAVLNVPHDIIQAEPVKAFRGVSNLLGIAHDLM